MNIMKYQKPIIPLCALLLALVGCEKKAATLPVSDGTWTVNHDTGMATGKDAFGIDFEMAGATKVESKFDLSGNPENSSRVEVALADDLEIELVTMNGGDIVAFHLNGRKFGNLKRGDKVVIDEERNVTVNGETRPPAESPPE